MHLPLLPTVEAAKRLAAYAAVDDHIDLDQKVRVIGLCAVFGAHDRLLVSDQDQRYHTLLTVLSNKV